MLSRCSTTLTATLRPARGCRACASATARVLPVPAGRRGEVRHASTYVSGRDSGNGSERGSERGGRAAAPWIAGGIALAALAYAPRLLNDELVDDPSPPAIQSTGSGLIPYGEVQKHNTPEDCWVVIDGKVYDLTEFASSGHPGGAAPIHRVAGKDASAIFNPLHPPGTIEHGLDPEAYVGQVDPQTLPQVLSHSSSAAAADGGAAERQVDLAEIIGLPDFDAAAKARLTGKAWAYMKSGATDEYTLDLNRRAFNWVLFRPRIMVDVDVVDTRTQFLGHETSMPFFISPAGMAGLAHPLGERLLSTAAGEAGIIQMISTNASAPLAEIVNARSHPDQKFFMQLYVDRNRPKCEKLLSLIKELDMKAIFVTVDAAAPGKREADERSRAEIEVASGISGGKIAQDSKGGGIGRSVGGFIDPKLSWADVAWLRRHTDVPIGLKGVQCVEDAQRAAEMGIEAVYLSNHGGRALDGSSPALYTLLELRKLAPEVFDKCEVYLDGGVRRGTDVVKALCLGAKGVGLGRPFLYSLTYGKEGVTHAIEIMRDEIQTTMRLLGVTRIDQLGPHLLNTRALDSQVLDELPRGK